MKEKKLLYSCVKLDEAQKIIIRDWFCANILLNDDYLEILSKSYGKQFNDIEDNIKIYCDHMTIAFGEPKSYSLREWIDLHENEVFEMHPLQLGISDKAIAISVKTIVPSDNTIKHITFATNRLTNGKPYDSNKITQWFLINFRTTIKGTITKVFAN